ncbi:unnamed protein product [Brassica rapa subsp. narinosa]
MANFALLPADLKVGQSVAPPSKFARLWDAGIVKESGDFMGVDMLLLDAQVILLLSKKKGRENEQTISNGINEAVEK